MKKTLFLLLLVPFYSFTQPLFSGGYSQTFLINPLFSNMETGFGVALGMESPFSSKSKAAGVLNVGFNYYPFVAIGTAMNIPVEAGVKFYVSEGQEGFYAQLTNGLQVNMFRYMGYASTDMYYSLTPGIGALINDKIDVSAGCSILLLGSYTIYNIGIGVRYVFNN